MKHYNWSVTEVESWIPWERDIYVEQLKNWIREQEKT